MESPYAIAGMQKSLSKTEMLRGNKSDRLTTSPAPTQSRAIGRVARSKISSRSINGFGIGIPKVFINQPIPQAKMIGLRITSKRTLFTVGF